MFNRKRPSGWGFVYSTVFFRVVLFKRKKARMVGAMRALWVGCWLSVHSESFRVVFVSKVVFVPF